MLRLDDFLSEEGRFERGKKQVPMGSRAHSGWQASGTEALDQERPQRSTTGYLPNYEKLPPGHPPAIQLSVISVVLHIQ